MDVSMSSLNTRPAPAANLHEIRNEAWQWEKRGTVPGT